MFPFTVDAQPPSSMPPDTSESDPAPLGATPISPDIDPILVPGPGVEPNLDGPVNSWKTKTNGEFAVRGPMAAGWLRLDFRARRLDRLRPEREEARIEAVYDDGSVECLEKMLWTEILSDEVYVRLPRPAASLRFRPLEGAATLVIEAFTLERLPTFSAIRLALKKKLRLIRAYRCTGRVILRGLALLLTGRVGIFFNKLFKGLPDSRLMRPENDFPPEAYSAWWRRRALTDQERHRLRVELAALPSTPTLPVILPVNHISEVNLRLSIESVRRQIYPHWELVTAIHPSANPCLRVILNRYMGTDPRIRVVCGAPADTPAQFTNAALETIGQSHFVFFNQGYELAEGALLHLAQVLVGKEETAAIVNRSTPLVEDNSTREQPAETFRTGAGGQEVNLFRVRDVKEIGGFSDWNPTAPPGVELARRLDTDGPIHYLPGVLAYPTSTFVPVEFGKAGGAGAARVGMFSQPLLITGNIVGISGYDYLVYEVARGLLSLGVDVRLNAESHFRGDLIPPYFAPLVRGRAPGDRELLIAPPHLLEHTPHPPGCAIFTMWESDRLQASWVKKLNQASLVLTPSQWGIDSFRASGVVVPMERVSLGHDPVSFHPTMGPPEICTFGAAAALWAGGMRKNIPRIIEAFQRAFPQEDDVRLRVKITPKCELPEPSDPRIEILRCYLSQADLTDWYLSLTAFVNASAGEGFGLHLVEALACGIPLISPAFSAVTEYFDDKVGYTVPHRLVPAEVDPYPGSWCQVDDEGVVAAMRQVYRDPSDAAHRGQRAVARSRRFTWRETGRQLMAALERHFSREQP